MAASDDLSAAVAAWWGALKGWAPFDLGDVAGRFDGACAESWTVAGQWPFVLEAMTGMVFAAFHDGPDGVRTQVETWLEPAPETAAVEWPTVHGWSYRAKRDTLDNGVWTRYWWTARDESRSEGTMDPPDGIWAWKSVFIPLARSAFLDKGGSTMLWFTIWPERADLVCVIYYGPYTQYDYLSWTWTLDTPPEAPPEPGEAEGAQFTDTFKAAMTGFLGTVDHALQPIKDTRDALNGWVFYGFGSGLWESMNVAVQG